MNLHRWTWVVRVAMALTAISAALGWVAIGRAATSTADALAATEAALVNAETVAASSAEIVEQVGSIADALDVGLVDVGDALVATGAVSSNLRSTLDFLGRFSGSVDDLMVSLQGAEQSIDAVIVDLEATRGELAASRPALDRAAAATREIPGDIRLGRAELAASIAEIRTQTTLWRAALVLGVVALLAVFLAVDAALRRPQPIGAGQP